MASTKIGYARCSTDRQDLSAQKQALTTVANRFMPGAGVDMLGDVVAAGTGAEATSIVAPAASTSSSRTSSNTSRSSSGSASGSSGSAAGLFN